MEPKLAIVIDDKGNKLELVLVNYIEGYSKTKEIPYAYTMQEGESLVYEGISDAISMIKPRWNGTGWEETATLEEIKSAMASRHDFIGNYPEPMKPTEFDCLRADIDYIAIMTGVEL